MGRATDRSRIQFRMLNRSKEPAVRPPRAQCDRRDIAGGSRSAGASLRGKHHPGYSSTPVASKVARVQGIVTLDGRRFLLLPSFSRPLLSQGCDPSRPRYSSTRWASRRRPHGSDIASHCGSWTYCKSIQTGFPPRIDGRTVDLARLDRQDGDADPFWFSFYERSDHPAQAPCYLTYTGDELKDIIIGHLRESALYGGAISGRGPILPIHRGQDRQVPRRCAPSGLPGARGERTPHVNGLSTSLPTAVQLDFLRGFLGLENVRIDSARF